MRRHRRSRRSLPRSAPPGRSAARSSSTPAGPNPPRARAARQVGGDTRGALAEIRAAIARGSSSIANRLADEIAVQAEPLSSNNDPAVAARTPIGDAPGFKAGGGIVIEIHPHRHGFPLWTPPADPIGVASFAPALGAWQLAHKDDGPRLHARYVAARDAANAAIPAYLQAHSDGITIPRFDTRVVNVLDDYAVVYQARVRQALKPFDDARKKAIPDAMASAMPAKCEQRGVLARQLNASLGSAYAQAARRLRSTVEDYLTKTDPYLDSVWQPDLQRALQLQRQELVTSAASRLRGGVAEWSGTLATILCNGREATPEAVKNNDPTVEPTVAEPAPGKCRIPTGHIALGVVSIDYACEGFTIQGGEGLFGGIDVRFKGPSGHMEQKLFIGAGAEAAGDQLSGEGKAVIFITKAGSQVVDFGAEYGVRGKAEYKGQSIEGSYDLSASWRGGPSMAASGKATLFGTEHELWRL